MRFLADGPSIPDELLEASDRGDMIFLCGAGVSRPAGLPGFAELARQVVAKLGTPSDAPARVLLEQILRDPSGGASLDQVFQHLKNDYGAVYIDEVVGDLLDPPSSASAEQHAILLRLSRNAAGRAQLVTTNFDHLFERADPSLTATAIVAPALPDLANGEPLEGIVYLHGRRRIRTEALRRPTQLILGSADFGRAYLAQGWATRFMNDLLRHNTIVLVGYSATDPPVRYLLEGIHSLGEERTSRIHAFDRGAQELVQARWRDRGVRALAYSGADNEHASLWGSLRAWADRVDDVDRWRRSISELAMQGPTALRAHQRGQVASLVSSDAGAKAFRDHSPPAPAEWLCVFDRNIRFGKPKKGSEGRGEFDPLVHYGLDDDPARRPATAHDAPPFGVNLIATLASEHGAGRETRLAGGPLRGTEPITPRLFHLAHWASSLLDDPIAAWWVAGYRSLHPTLVDFLESKLQNSQTELHPMAYRTWRLLLEKMRQGPRDPFDERWFPFARRLQRDGWTSQVLREFEHIMQPRFTCSRSPFGGHEPPSAAWDRLHFRQLAHFGVAILRPDPENVAISTEALPEVFRILRRGLERAAGMLADIDTMYWRTTTLIPQQGYGQVHLDDLDKHLLWIARLFDRLATEHPGVAHDEVQRWGRDEEFFFDKLHLYAWRNQQLVSGPEVAAGILGFSESAFWNAFQRRELLHVLAERWADMDAQSRELIETRIIAGRARLDEEQEGEYQTRKATTAARMLGWLQSHGAALSNATSEALTRLRAADPRWQDSLANNADASSDARSGFVRVDADPSQILDAPLSEVVARAAARTGQSAAEFTEYDPFRGLIERSPRRALAALSYEARRQEYPATFWRTLLQHWPEKAPVRLHWALAERLVRLPPTVIFDIRYAAANWFEKHLSGLSQRSLEAALSLWDRLFDALSKGGDAAAESALGDTYIDGEAQQRSRRTHDYGVNSPPGRLARALLNVLDAMKVAAGGLIPDGIRSRLSVLLSTSGDARDYTLSELARSLTWLYQIDPEWTREQMIQRLDPASADSEPTWSGYQYDPNLANPGLFVLLKPHFLSVFPWLSRWQWNDGALRHFAELLVAYCYKRQYDERYLTYAEARTVLQQTSDIGRSHAAWMLARILREQQGAWRTFGKPFIENAWPRELRSQSSSTSTHLVEAARAADRDFPDAVDTILQVLVPVEHADIILHRVVEERAGGDSDANLVERFPAAFLALIDRIIPRDGHSSAYGLGAAVQALAVAMPALRQDPRWRRLNEIANRG